MSFDILEAINEATKEADAFENHPIAQLSLEEKLLYLQGLALVMNVDGDIDANELEYIRILIKSVGLEESVLDDMNSFAQAPDKDTIQAFFRTYRRRPIAQLFLFDALMMTRRDGKVDDKEKAIIDKLAQQLEVLKGTQRDIFDLFCHIKNKNWQESALYFSSHLLNPEHFKHLLDYHKVDGDALLAETQEIRAKRLLQLLAAKMPAADLDAIEGDFVIPSLDHDLVMPMLQAEIDCGNAEVVNGKMTIKDATEMGEIDLKTLGLGWDNENYAIFSVGSKKIICEKVVSYFVKYVSKLSFTEQVYILTKGQHLLPVAELNESETSLTVSDVLRKSFPYLFIKNRVYILENNTNSDAVYTSKVWKIINDFQESEKLQIKIETVGMPVSMFEAIASASIDELSDILHPITEEQQVELLEQLITEGIPKDLFLQD